MTTTALKTIIDIAEYIVESGYHRQRNEDGSTNFNFIDSDLYIDEAEGKIVLPKNHDIVEATYEYMSVCEVFVSPVAASITFDLMSTKRQRVVVL